VSLAGLLFRKAKKEQLSALSVKDLSKLKKKLRSQRLELETKRNLQESIVKEKARLKELQRGKAYYLFKSFSSKAGEGLKKNVREVVRSAREKAERNRSVWLGGGKSDNYFMKMLSSKPGENVLVKRLSKGGRVNPFTGLVEEEPKRKEKSVSINIRIPK